MPSDANLSQCLQRENNNYDLLRLLAACAVIIGHSRALVPGGAASPDFIGALFRGEYAGSLAVKFFFFLSGLVVCNSLLTRRDLLGFFVARGFRILPGLVVCLLLCVFVLGSVFSTLPWRDYATHPNVWQFLGRNLVLWPVWELPGVFQTNPNHAVNGSLWTLRLEVLCYIGLFGFAFVGALYSRLIGSIVMIAIIVVSFLMPSAMAAAGFNTGESSPLPACFAFGAVLAINQTQFKISVVYFGALAILFLLLQNTGAYQPLLYATVFYGALVLASARWIVRLKLRGDYSYGVYIYGFPVQQSLVALWPELSLHLHQGIALTLTILLAVASWRWVEKPSIGAGRRLITRLKMSANIRSTSGKKI